ncbi:MAG: hypothetical protein C0490_17930 [Marivirga sp.]|nr:hypothetical protein [Marivirga sp.]
MLGLFVHIAYLSSDNVPMQIIATLQVKRMCKYYNFRKKDVLNLIIVTQPDAVNLVKTNLLKWRFQLTK